MLSAVWNRQFFWWNVEFSEWVGQVFKVPLSIDCFHVFLEFKTILETLFLKRTWRCKNFPNLAERSHIQTTNFQHAILQRRSISSFCNRIFLDQKHKFWKSPILCSKFKYPFLFLLSFYFLLISQGVHSIYSKKPHSLGVFCSPGVWLKISFFPCLTQRLPFISLKGKSRLMDCTKVHIPQTNWLWMGRLVHLRCVCKVL